MAKNDGSRPEKQHTVSSFLLERFSVSDGDKKFVFQHRSPLVNNQCVPVNVKKASIKKNIYTTADANGQKNFSMELALAKLESDIAPVVRLADENGINVLSAQQEYDLSFFMAVQLFRTPKVKSVVDTAFLQLQDTAAKLNFLDENEVALRRRASQEEIDLYRNAIRDGTDGMSAFADDFYVNAIMKQLTKNVPNRIMAMDWRTERVCKRQDSFFVVSDNPFAVRRKGRLLENKVIGLDDPDAEFYFPLSYKTMLIGSHGIVRQAKCASRMRVNELNKISFANRHNMIWSPTESEETRQVLIALDEFRIPSPNPSSLSSQKSSGDVPSN